jgi:hypothetical protein
MSKSINEIKKQKRVNTKHLKQKVEADISPSDLQKIQQAPEIQTSKADTNESNRRRNIILNMLLDGYGTASIISFCTAEFGIKIDQIRKYIKQAKAMLAKFEEKDISNTITWYKAAQKRLYNRAVQRNNLSVAKDVLENMAKSRKFDAQIGTAENPVHVIQIVRPEGNEPEKESK